MNALIMADPLRITISLSAYEGRKLICWAKIHGKPKATYAAQIIGARIEANLDTIYDQMKDIAEHQGISVQELEQRWLREENFSAE
jgi:hypothetical protein